MLKIKENVDLKELEKFGFTCEYGFSGDCNTGYWELKQQNYRGRIIVRKNKKIMTFNQIDWYSGSENPIPDLLFDLIQAGLVEKVGDEN